MLEIDLLKFTPLEFKTWAVRPNTGGNGVKIYSVGV